MDAQFMQFREGSKVVVANPSGGGESLQGRVGTIVHLSPNRAGIWVTFDGFRQSPFAVGELALAE